MTPTVTAPAWKGRLAVAKPRGRLVELDILRGFLLLWMTLTHLPTRASLISNQTFGFVSGAEGFIFLAGFMVGQLEVRRERKDGPRAALRDVAKRTARVYIYHIGLIAITFTIFAEIGVAFHRLSLENLLSFYLQNERRATIAAVLLQYRPSLLDILPMYVVFLLLTPLARAIGRRWGWDVVIYTSFLVWAAAQFGLRMYVHGHWALFGVAVPDNSIGAFDLYGWQLLWMVALALGTHVADQLYDTGDAVSVTRLPRWLLRASAVVAATFLVLRYSPWEHIPNMPVFDWLVDKWHLGLARVLDFSAIAVLLARYGTRIARLRILAPLASLGQASLEVFCVHVLCCFSGHALSREADPDLPLSVQAMLIVFTLAAMFGTAYLARHISERRKANQQAAVKAET